MLKVISLHTIQKIFEYEVLKPVSALSKLSYINTLIFYFEGKEATVDNCKAFEIPINQVKNPNKTMKYYIELQEAGLVKINDTTISFPNKWFKYIDKNLLDKVTPQEYVGMVGAKSITEFEQNLLKGGSAFELLGMRHKLSTQRITELIREFILEQKTKESVYYSDADVAKHCINWFNKRIPLLPKSQQGGTGKILGL